MNLRTLIDARQLRDITGSRSTLVVDCRVDLSDPVRGEQSYNEGHIPGSVFAHLNRDLSDLSKSGVGRHPLPDATAFARVLGGWGWDRNQVVVTYDDAGGSLAAARLWWMLRLIGHRDVAVLDGGFGAWKDAGFPLESKPVTRTPNRDLDVSFDLGQIVYTDELQQISDRVLLLDARAAPRFRGEVEPIDPVAGHVPGARNRPFSENLAAGRFKSTEDLRREFSGLLGAIDANSVVHMCGSGVTACHNLLAMEHAGLSGSRIYAPSWSGWISDSQRPIAKG